MIRSYEQFVEEVQPYLRLCEQFLDLVGTQKTRHSVCSMIF